MILTLINKSAISSTYEGDMQNYTQLSKYSMECDSLDDV